MHCKIIYEMDLRKAIAEYQLELSYSYSSIFPMKVAPFSANRNKFRDLNDAHPISFAGRLYERHPELIWTRGYLFKIYRVKEWISVDGSIATCASPGISRIFNNALLCYGQAGMVDRKRLPKHC